MFANTFFAKIKSFCFLAFVIILTLLGFPNLQYAQQNKTQEENTNKKSEITSPTHNVGEDESPSKILVGPEAASSLYKVSIETFEGPLQWHLDMAYEQGVGSLLLRRGSPAPLTKKGEEIRKIQHKDPKPLRLREEDGTFRQEYYSEIKDPHNNILGGKIRFRRRGHHKFAILLNKPVYLEGLVKQIEAWVVGRQRSFTLSAIVEDVFGDEKLIPMGKLDFQGWKKLSGNIPTGIAQFHYPHHTKRGLLFKGFLVTCSLLETFGDYYIYFDNISVELSRLGEEYTLHANPADTW